MPGQAYGYDIAMAYALKKTLPWCMEVLLASTMGTSRGLSGKTPSSKTGWEVFPDSVA